MRLEAKIPALAAAALLAVPATSGAQPRAPHHTRASLVSETESIRPGQPFWMALRLEMDEHWHTYWINPGDSGLPTKISWQLPEGFTAGELHWPRPELFAVGPLASYGYSDSVLLLAELTPPAELEPGPVRIAGLAEWLECEEICLPGKAEVGLTLPVRDEPPEAGEWARRFAETRRLLAADPDGWSLEAGSRDGRVALSVTPPAGWGEPPTEAYFFASEPEIVEYPEPQRLVLTGSGYRVEMAASSYGSGFERLRGVLVADRGGPDGGELVLAVDAPVTEAATAAIGSPGVAAPAAARLGLPLALLFAFVGGLILNLMPCVLPVLSLKVLSLVREGGGEPGGRAWRHGLAFTAGVLVFFWILAGSLLALRAAGTQVGWGFQLQAPEFVVFLVFLFFAIGLNLFGVFEVGTSLTRAGAAADHKTGLAGSFWGGALATIVATPCTAPFMGSALGFALGQPAWVGLLIFTCLGLGMAAPYLLLTRFPVLMRFVPRPGPWMESFKQLMGFFIMATVVFLLWLFGRQVGVNGMGLLLAGLVVVGLGGWIYGRGSAPGAPRRSRVLAAVSAAVLAVLGVLIGLAPVQASPGHAERAAVDDGSGIAWEPYSEQRLAELRAAGTPVFIDFTADWCLTCQVNERVAFTAAVRERFEREGVAMLKADWTLRDDAITRALASYGRQGVPLYVLYGPSGEPRLLPELLSSGVVLAALDDAF